MTLLPASLQVWATGRRSLDCRDLENRKPSRDPRRHCVRPSCPLDANYAAEIGNVSAAACSARCLLPVAKGRQYGLSALLPRNVASAPAEPVASFILAEAVARPMGLMICCATYRTRVHRSLVQGSHRHKALGVLGPPRLRRTPTGPVAAWSSRGSAPEHLRPHSVRWRRRRAFLSPTTAASPGRGPTSAKVDFTAAGPKVARATLIRSVAAGSEQVLRVLVCGRPDRRPQSATPP